LSYQGSPIPPPENCPSIEHVRGVNHSEALKRTVLRGTPWAEASMPKNSYAEF
jgi:hypothetical protein